MTLEEIKRSDKLFLTPADVAPVIGCDPQTLRIMAREDPALLGFPVTVMKSRTRIPRIPFIKFLEGGADAWTENLE